MKDQRRFKRISFKEPLKYYLQADSKSFGGCLGYDVSEGGLRFRSEDFIPLNTEIIFDFELRKEEIVDLNAKVKWVQKFPHAECFQIGVEFLDSEHNRFPRKKLRQFITSEF